MCKRLEVIVTSGEIFDVTFKWLVLYDGKLQLHGLTSEDVWLFLCDAKRRLWQWKYMRTIEHWYVRYQIWELNSYGSAFSVPNLRDL